MIDPIQSDDEDLTSGLVNTIEEFDPFVIKIYLIKEVFSKEKKTGYTWSVCLDDEVIDHAQQTQPKADKATEAAIKVAKKLKGKFFKNTKY